MDIDKNIDKNWKGTAINWYKMQESIHIIYMCQNKVIILT